MHLAVLQAALTLLVTAVLVGHVAMRRDKSSLHWHLIALLGALAIWSAGTLWYHAAAGEAERQAAHAVTFLGIFNLPALWLLLAARVARIPEVEDRPDVVVALLTPGLLFWIAMLSNGQHQLMAGEVEAGSREWGPLLWASLAWSYACVLGGVLLFVRRARWMATPHERRRATSLALAGLVPLAANASHLLEWIDWAVDPTPLSLGLSAVLVYALVFRFKLLENLPLVRRDLLEHLPEGVLIADPSGLVQDVNPTAERIIGRSKPELRGVPIDRALQSLAADDSVAPLLASLAASEQGEAPRAGELRTRDGRRLEVTAAAVHGRSGDPAGRFVVIRDVTAARRIETALRHGQRLESVGVMAAGIAHEVNNPLAFVQANLLHLQSLAQRLAEQAQRAAGEHKPEADLVEMPEVVTETLEGVDRIARIVASLRRLSRQAEESIDAAVDLNEVVRESVRLAGLHRTPGVALETALDPALPPVRGARDRLIQVLLNLLLNAKQALAASGGGRVLAETRLRGGAVEVSVSDDGPGILEADQQRIFDPFFTTKGPDEGTGLGLSIAWDIVREHGGWMELESEPGRGCTFRVRLPRHATDARADVPAPDASTR